MPRRPYLMGLLLTLACACGPTSAPSAHRRLAYGFKPQPTPSELKEAWRVPLDGGEPLTLRAAQEPHAVWVETSLPASRWVRRAPGFWRAPRLLAGEGAPSIGAAQTFSAGGTPFTHVSPQAALRNLADVQPNAFSTMGQLVYAYTGPNAGPPVDARLREYLELGHAENDVWRVRIGRYVADGLPVLPGHPAHVTTPWPKGHRLCFLTAARAHAPDGSPPLTFRVRAGDEVLFEFVQPVALAPATHEVNYAAARGEDVELTFEVEGGAALGAFLKPVLGPAQPVPEEQRLPDLFIFLADTFRADNLTAFGGTEELAPVLDQLARESRRFPRAWSASTWTLPSHATLFSGLWPYQSGVTSRDSALPSDVVTLAEHLQRAGYRTGAITDHAFVSSSYGLDQGFEWFDEMWAGLDDTLDGVRRFLDADDGRPVFLFVHTYQTHVAYRPTPETRERRGIELDWEGFQEATRGVSLEPEEGVEPSPEVTRLRDIYRDLYLGTVVDLDAGFARFRDELQRRGHLEQGYLAFTSDHGEGFWEHGWPGHGFEMYEEHLRIPLFLNGPGLAAGEDLRTAGLVDLPRTLCALAGLPAHPDWGGVDLNAPAGATPERPAIAFQCVIDGRPSDLVVVDGTRKVRASPDALDQVLRAHDLEQDPRELDERSATGDPWPRELLERHIETLRDVLDPRHSGSAVHLTPEERERLDALGYGGGDE